MNTVIETMPPTPRPSPMGWAEPPPGPSTKSRHPTQRYRSAPKSVAAARRPGKRARSWIFPPLSVACMLLVSFAMLAVVLAEAVDAWVGLG